MDFSKRSRTELVAALEAGGYDDLRGIGEVICGIRRFNYTTAIVVGLDKVGYVCRYCYEHKDDAQIALRAWDGEEHPGGPWMKCKGDGIAEPEPRTAFDELLAARRSARKNSQCAGNTQ